MKTDLYSQLKQYLTRKNAITFFNGTECIACKAPNAMYYSEDRKACYCSACEKEFTIYDLAARDSGATTRRAQERYIYRVLGWAYDNPRTPGEEREDAAQDPERGKAFFEGKGISADTLAAFNVGYIEGANRKIDNAHELVNGATIEAGEQLVIYRTCDDGSTQRIGQKEAYLFNAEALAAPVVFVTSDELDALSIIEAGAQAVATDKAGRELINRIKNAVKKPVLVMALQGDDETENTIEEELQTAGALTVRSKPFLTETTANAALQLYRDDFAEFVKQIDSEAATAPRAAYIKQYETAARIDAVIHKLATTGKPTSTGIRALDTLLNGGFREGVYMLGAKTGAGKTAFAVQLADNMASTGTDVLYYSLEMAESELVSRSISKATYVNAVKKYGTRKGEQLAKTVSGILSGYLWNSYSEEENALIREAFDEYRRRGNVFILEGVGEFSASDVVTGIERHISATGKRPVVIVDYLQALAPYDPRATDKQNVDRAVIELKRASRRTGTAIIAISSFNRDNYDKDASLSAFKESGGIEYGADAVMALQLTAQAAGSADLASEERSDVRDVTIKILKNRNYKTGTETKFKYHTKFNYFEPVEMEDVTKTEKTPFAANQAPPAGIQTEIPQDVLDKVGAR